MVVVVLLMTVTTLGFAGVVHAAEASVNHWLVAPYFWAPTLKGAIAFSGTSLPVDLAPSDVASGIKLGALGYLQWSRDQHFIYFEGLGFRFSEKEFAPAHNLDVSAQVGYGEIGYGQNLSFDVNFPVPGRLWLSPYIGLRYSLLQFTASTPKGALLSNSTSVDDHWLDPAIGVIIETPLFAHVTGAAKLDAAGLGIGRDHYWSGLGMLRWYATPGLSFGLGYRASRFDADPGNGNDLRLRLRGQGPEAALSYSF
jgi:hypothetical protein